MCFALHRLMQHSLRMRMWQDLFGSSLLESGSDRIQLLLARFAGRNQSFGSWLSPDEQGLELQAMGVADRDLESRIRQRAHQIWEEEGRPEGRDREHWVRASREVMGTDVGAAGDENRDFGDS